MPQPFLLPRSVLKAAKALPLTQPELRAAHIVPQTCQRQSTSSRPFSSLRSQTASKQTARAEPSSHTLRASTSSSTPRAAALPPRRHFSSTAPTRYKTIEEARSRYKSGPFSWKAGVLFLLAGAGMIVYFQSEKARLERKRIADQTKGMGRPKVGGPFTLVDHDGKTVTEKDFMGKYSLVYFGFTHCPDICPEELDKMAQMIDLVKARVGNVLTPIFITCDPARDTPAVMKTYLAEFHPDLVGLTGPWEEIKNVCKAYRVYFSTPPNVKPGQDYLVDHSIYFYLMDPEGDFVEALGRNFTPEQAAKVINGHIGDWRGKLVRS